MRDAAQAWQACDVFKKVTAQRESQNHLLDFVDTRYISEEVRLEVNQWQRRPGGKREYRTMKLNTNRERKKQKSEPELTLRHSKVGY